MWEKLFPWTKIKTDWTIHERTGMKSFVSKQAAVMFRWVNETRRFFTQRAYKGPISTAKRERSFVRAVEVWSFSACFMPNFATVWPQTSLIRGMYFTTIFSISQRDFNQIATRIISIKNKLLTHGEEATYKIYIYYLSTTAC